MEVQDLVRMEDMLMTNFSDENFCSLLAKTRNQMQTIMIQKKLNCKTCTCFVSR